MRERLIPAFSTLQLCRGLELEEALDLEFQSLVGLSANNGMLLGRTCKTKVSSVHWSVSMIKNIKTESFLYLQIITVVWIPYQLMCWNT
jgi:hypothetical protein